ncbi:prepilin-type N-terminal cleavage/methylation domain-containing protein [Alteromonas ponticola]|uniref:Prepilin-type N-terminal cleavage/methylation domain-containing protein n=1 Tax=Alteromonas ponticola TaxID=2720613 RepID=A0ABX1QXH5_9ALTE|nr:prepilin-type N-terminal cleavage/methylation domain-containing protein [Alteromonas ponticola]NMH58953.1 prepilin-type N-terminal cleavage/methylation domain-containing protein [Alteromonas ponticola]
MLKPAHGFSLIELLITMAMSVALFAGVITLTSQLLTSQRHLSASLEVENELSLIEEILTNEIRRAGYNEHAVELFLSRQRSPFLPAITLRETGVEGIADCILFSYDKNRNGILDTGIPDERYGFKLHDKALEVRRDGATCEQGGWHDLTDPRSVKVTDFALSQYISPAGSRFLYIHIKAHHTQFSQLLHERKLIFKVENG